MKNDKTKYYVTEPVKLNVLCESLV